jgi:hypothetical protein
VGISAQILQDALGSIEGRLAVDDPFLIVKLPSEALKDMWCSQMTNPSGKDKISRFESPFEKVKELSPKQCRHYPDRDEEPLTARHPTIPFQGQPSAGNDTVDMGMIHKVLSPGMKNAQEADPCPQMLRIG